jgi:putative transposase
VSRGRQPSLYLQFLLLVFASWVNRHQQAVIEYLQAENRSLREQLSNKRIQWTDAQRRWLAEKAKAMGRSVLASLGTVVTPDTLLRWYRNLVAAKYDGSKKRGPGQPRREPDITKLAIRMARENPTWGYTRIRGALFNLGHDTARNTIKAILRGRGIEPAPERGRHSSRHTFITSHLGAAGADFFTVEVLRGFRLVRYYVFFVLDVGSRRIHVAGITHQPGEAWMNQVARNLTDCVDGFLTQTRYLILDRDPLYTKAFRRMLKDAGVNIVGLPARSPNLNSHAERWIGSLRSECLCRIIPLGEMHLRDTIVSYTAHYHRERNHQGLGNRLIEPTVANTNASVDRIRRRQKVGGLLNYYYREAA